MPRSSGNSKLREARRLSGYPSQETFAAALNRAAPQIGLGARQVSVRQVRRWESATPPWPQPDYQRLISHVLRLPVEELGFTPPGEEPGMRSSAPPTARSGRRRTAVQLPSTTATVQPPGVSADYAAITAAHRRFYGTVPATALHPAAVEHARLGAVLLAQTSGAARRLVAASVSETLLLAGRIEFFDLRQSDDAEVSFRQALQAAAEADDPLLGAAILAHAAFVPGWAGRREEATERMRAARAYARRGPACVEFLAWLDAVEAECETRCGHSRDGLRLITHAEEILDSGNDHAAPDWFDWFSPARLASFKGNTQLTAGHLPQARQTLSEALERFTETSGKQRAVILGDLAAVEAADGRPEAACSYAGQALDLLTLNWYATAMDRIREVRHALQPWAGQDCVRALDDRLYDWDTTLNALLR